MPFFIIFFPTPFSTVIRFFKQKKNETPQLLMFCKVKAQIRHKSVEMTDWKKKFV